MNFQVDQYFFREIDGLFDKTRLDPEMERLVRVSLNADCTNGEYFRWANLTLLSCECVGGELEDVLPGAIGMELFALASDIFDDIQDQDNEEMPWRQIPDAQAINLASCLLMLCEEAISAIPDNHLYREVAYSLHRTGIRAINGQFREFMYDSYKQVSFEQYFKMTEQKAGSLTACACKIGAILGKAETIVIQDMEQFGVILGILGQIINDLKDFLDFPKKNDFINNKKTLPNVYLLNTLQGEMAERFKDLTQKVSEGAYRIKDMDREYIKQLALEEGVVPYCTVMYEIYCQKAREILEEIPVPEINKEKLKRLVREIK